LEVSASGRGADSVSRQLSRDLIAALADRYQDIDVVRRDLADGVPFVDQPWIESNFTAPESRSHEQREALSYSDSLVAELQQADIVVIGVPMYNFSIPASLKAWIDMIARARLTFRYTENGPEGLLQGKKAYLVVATGGVPVGSPMDFATPYLKHVLSFVGITDVEIIAAEKLNTQAEDSMDAARARIAEVVHLSAAAA
jgi:FMN-dependent NADH-azoreductase